ncbi:MAG: protein-L-isoaspartate(D-aspartate) O-methyltransferase [Methanobacteriota archaeon]
MTMDRGRVRERSEMVNTQLRSRGIKNLDVLRAMSTIPRHMFAPKHLSDEAYADHPLPIGHDQTISQPYIVAQMTELLSPVKGDNILEIGTGSGYQAAIISAIGARVISLERLAVVADLARENLRNAGIETVTVHVSDGTLGWPDGAPYDGIIITAATPQIPVPLMSQMAVGGRLIAPVGPPQIQDLVRLTRTNDGYQEERFGSVRFVPLIGEYGWKDKSRTL